MVEIAELLVKEHKLPLIIAGHSGGGVATLCATDRIVKVCKDNGVPLVTALYLSPGIGGFPAPCGLTCCRVVNLPILWACCCCNCCDQPCLKVGPGAFNPAGVLGEQNDLAYLNLRVCCVNAQPFPGGGAGLNDVVAHTKDAVSGSLLFYGTKDMPFVKANVPKLGELRPQLKVEAKEGLPHDYLNMNKDGDLTSSETIEYLVGYAETKLNNLP